MSAISWDKMPRFMDACRMLCNTSLDVCLARHVDSIPYLSTTLSVYFSTFAFSFPYSRPWNYIAVQWWAPNIAFFTQLTQHCIREVKGGKDQISANYTDPSSAKHPLLWPENPLKFWHAHVFGLNTFPPPLSSSPLVQCSVQKCRMQYSRPTHHAPPAQTKE